MGSSRQFEKNVHASFAYVKKDMLMLNDTITSLHDQIQHLSINQAVLLEKLQKVEDKFSAMTSSTTKKVTKKTSKKR